jgi:integrase
MPLGKQAKVLSKAQVNGALNYLAKTRHPVRNRAILLLLVKAGLRAKEIASLTRDMVTDLEGRSVRRSSSPTAPARAVRAASSRSTES